MPLVGSCRLLSVIRATPFFCSRGSGKSPDESLFIFGRGVDAYQPTSYRRGNVRVTDVTETSEF